MIQIDDFEALKRKVERLKREDAEAAGAEKQLAARAREEFGCESLEEIERLLASLQDEEPAAAEEVTAKREAFERILTAYERARAAPDEAVRAAMARKSHQTASESTIGRPPPSDTTSPPKKKGIKLRRPPA